MNVEESPFFLFCGQYMLVCGILTILMYIVPALIRTCSPLNSYHDMSARWINFLDRKNLCVCVWGGGAYLVKGDECFHESC